MVDSKPQCGLCGQRVLIPGFELNTLLGEKKFCCEGCRSIFQLLHSEQIIITTPEEK
ncbi:metal-binding protein [Methylomonas sp. LW13]|nr:metal-binding protein [Methylomonas sp. ZR1]PKD41843.1 metal-binding protein [Methylomonas sp. Kb3]QBC26755.1 metal-binding protein [Methylomonas sp. LW13]